MEWTITKNSKKPIYVQIREFIMNKISSGEWFVGYKLPTQREIATTLNVNRSTVKYALEEMVADGILETRGKAGTYVKNNTWSLHDNFVSPNWLKYLKSGSIMPNREITHSVHNYEFDTRLIRLSTGELSPKLFRQDIVDDALKTISSAPYVLDYSHPNGLYELREALCDYYAALGMAIEPDQVMIVSGALQALHLIALGMIQRGSIVLSERPSYLYSLSMLESLGVKVGGVPLSFDGVDCEALDLAAQNPKVAAYYTIPYFHNPTGTCLSDRCVTEVLKTCKKHRLPVIEDDTYRELYYDGHRRFPLKAFDSNQSVIHIGSISKTFCAGLRVGWIIGQKEIIGKLADLKMQTDYGTSSLSQLVLCEILKNGSYEQNLEFLRTELKTRRDEMLEVLENDFSDIASWNTPQGGFFVFLTIRSKVDMPEVFRYCVSKGVVINPGYMYDSKDVHTVRLSFAFLEKDEMRYALAVLKEAILASSEN